MKALQSDVVRFLVQELSKQVDWVIGDDVGDLKETDVESGHHKLHQIVAEWHLLDLLLALVSHQLAHLLRQLLSSSLNLCVTLHLLPHCVFFLLQALFVLFCCELPVLLEKGVFREKIVVRSAVLHVKICTLSMQLRRLSKISCYFAVEVSYTSSSMPLEVKKSTTSALPKALPIRLIETTLSGQYGSILGPPSSSTPYYSTASSACSSYLGYSGGGGTSSSLTIDFSVALGGGTGLAFLRLSFLRFNLLKMYSSYGIKLGKF